MLSIFKKQNVRGIIALGAVLLILAVLTDGTFLSPRNLTNLTRQVAINGILAVGMTYVILLGGIDLSVGSVVALAGVAAGIFQVNFGLAQWQGSMALWGALLSIFAAIGTGTACGVFNGYLITRHRIAPFIVTLGMMVIARGVALILANGAAISPLGDAFNFIGQEYLSQTASWIVLVGVWALATGIIFKTYKGRAALLPWVVVSVLVGSAITIFQGYSGVPIPVLFFAIFAAIGAIVLHKTKIGRFVLATGGNIDAAWLAGVPIKKITMGTYVVLGALAGLSGAILSARLNGALPTAGELFELDAIAAVVIGGTSLLGGVGSVQGSILGAFFIGALNNGMSLMDVGEFYQKVIKGVIIIVAVWLDQSKKKGRSL